MRRVFISTLLMAGLVSPASAQSFRLNFGPLFTPNQAQEWNANHEFSQKPGSISPFASLQELARTLGKNCPDCGTSKAGAGLQFNLLGGKAGLGTKNPLQPGKAFGFSFEKKW